MKKWIVDKQENYITVHEEGNPENYALREKAKLTYNGFGVVTGFQFDDSVIKQAHKVCEMLNLYEIFLEMEGKYALLLTPTKRKGKHKLFSSFGLGGK